MLKNKDYTIRQGNQNGTDTYLDVVSQTVKSWSEIKKEAIKLTKWLNDNNGSFDKPYETAYAVSHCQVAEKPYRMFVVADFFVNKKLGKKENYLFPAQAIINAEIIEAPETVEQNVPKREYYKDEKGKPQTRTVTVKGSISNRIQMQDACMSYRFRKPTKVWVYYRVKVRYQTKGLFGLKTHEEWVHGLKAHMFQHEINHANCLDIYHDYKNKHA